MIDFREYKTVPKTFELEQTIAENETYKYDNRFLIGLSVVVVIGAVGVVVYLVKEQRKVEERYRVQSINKIIV